MPCALIWHVNCRIGSLENYFLHSNPPATVNCRIGSLEKHLQDFEEARQVNCRIGSLEMER